MQQLLSKKASTTDGSFITELFLQHLPTNVHTVLASNGDKSNLEEVAHLADKIIEVAAPSITSVTTPQPTAEVDQLHAEIAGLRKLIRALLQQGDSIMFEHPTHVSLICLLNLFFVGNAGDFTQSVNHHVQDREMSRPATSSNKCCWSSTKLPLLCYGPSTESPLLCY